MWQWTRQRPQATTTPTSLSGQLPAGYREAVSPRAVPGPVFFQHREDLLAMPAAVPELHRHPHPARDQPEEIGQPGIIARQRGRQLDQQHRPLITQLVPARRDALQSSLRRVQLAGMGQAARCLDRQPEAVRQSVPPAAERRGPGPAVEAAVELGGRKGVGVAGEPVPSGKPRRVQLGVPVIVTPSRRADPDDQRGLSPSGDHEADGPPGSWPGPAGRPGGMSASTRAVDPAARVTVSSVRSRSRCSEPASPSGTVASSRELACTSGSRCCI